MFHSSYAAALIWTAVVYQLMVLSNAQNNAPGYLGCFEDRRFGGRSMRGDSTTSHSLSLEWCFKYCQKINIKAYKYAGVEYERECYCGNNEDYGRHREVADSDCRGYTCPGNQNQYCGGGWRIAIYQISEGVCNNAIGPPDYGSHYVKNPTRVSLNLDNSRFFGTSVTFECDTGYDIQGAETIECTQRGNIAEWSNSVPTCIVLPLTTISYTASSLLPTTMNQTNNTSMVTNIMDVTTSSGVPSSIPEATDRPEMFDPQTSQTGTIVGTVAGVIAALVFLLVVVIVVFRRRGNKRNTSSDVAKVDVTSSINQTQGDSDVTTEPNQASTIPVYSQVIRNQIKNENDNVYANPDDVTNSVASATHDVNLDVRPSLNEQDNGTRLVDNILYDSSSLKDKSQMRGNDLNEEHAGELTTMKGQSGWVENIIYE